MLIINFYHSVLWARSRLLRFTASWLEPGGTSLIRCVPVHDRDDASGWIEVDAANVIPTLESPKAMPADHRHDLGYGAPDFLRALQFDPAPGAWSAGGKPPLRFARS